MTILYSRDGFSVLDVCLYRFDEAVQVFHLESVWVHVVQVLKLSQQGLVVHQPAWTGGGTAIRAFIELQSIDIRCFKRSIRSSTH